MERGWFQSTFLGLDLYRPPRNAHDDAEFVIEQRRHRRRHPRLLSGRRWRGPGEIAAAADLDDHARRADRSATSRLRWIMVHMIEETARHVGHADILREQTDGAVGE